MMASRYGDGKRSTVKVVHVSTTSECTTVDIVGDLSATEQPSVTELISEVAYKDVSRHFIWKDMPYSYLDFWLEYYGQELLVDPDDKELEESG